MYLLVPRWVGLRGPGPGLCILTVSAYHRCPRSCSPPFSWTATMLLVDTEMKVNFSSVASTRAFRTDATKQQACREWLPHRPERVTLTIGHQPYYGPATDRFMVRMEICGGLNGVLARPRVYSTDQGRVWQSKAPSPRLVDKMINPRRDQGLVTRFLTCDVRVPTDIPQEPQP